MNSAQSEIRSTLGKHLPTFVLSAFVLFSMSVLFFFPKEIVFDQNFIDHKFELKDLTTSYDGKTLVLLIGIFNAIFSLGKEYLNPQIKIFAMLFYVIPAFFLAKIVLREPKYLVIFTIILFTSRFPFLWLSSELFTGGLLFLVIISVIRKSNPVLTGTLLVILAFTKADSLFLSFAFSLYLLVTKGSIKERVFLVATFFFVAFAFLPGIFSDLPLSRIYGNRGFISFTQHYSALVEKHQIIKPVPNPWEGVKEYRTGIIPKANSISSLIREYPKVYYDFLFLSFGHGVKRIVTLFNILLLFIPIIFLYTRKRKKTDNFNAFHKLFYISLLGFLPMILFSFPHIRYMARYFPLFIIFILSFKEQFSVNDPEKKKYSAVSNAILGGSISLNAFLFLDNIIKIKTIDNFWFPD